jgi:hypothetical protein
MTLVSPLPPQKTHLPEVLGITDGRIDHTKKSMGALVRMKPKPYKDMRL